MKKRLKGKLTKLDEKETKWLATVHLGYNPQKKQYDRPRREFEGNKGEAEAFLRDLIAELEVVEEEYSRQTVADWLDYWLEAYGKVIYKREQNTFDRAKRIVNTNIKPYMGEIPLGDLEPQHVVDLYKYLGTRGKVKKIKVGNLTEKIRVPLSARTVRYVHTVLNRSLNDAANLKMIESDPAKGLTPKAEKRKPHTKWVVLTAPQL